MLQRLPAKTLLVNYLHKYSEIKISLERDKRDDSLLRFVSNPASSSQHYSQSILLEAGHLRSGGSILVETFGEVVRGEDPHIGTCHAEKSVVVDGLDR